MKELKSAVFFWNQLKSELDDDLDNEGANLIETYREATEGADASQVQQLAMDLFKSLLIPNSFTKTHKFVLLLLLHDIASSKQAGIAISRSGKGAPKKGAKKFYIASEVVGEILDGDALTISSAWETVAAKENLSIDTVRTYWSERKESAVCYREDDFSLDGDYETIDDMLDAYLRRKRGKK